MRTSQKRVTIFLIDRGAPMELKRYPKNPILAPTKNWWEEYLVFNPAATIFKDKILLIYRAQGKDRISRFGLAASVDGFNFTRSEVPIFKGDEDNKYERLGVEDPRITKIGDTFFIVYTSASVYPANVKKKKFAPSLSSEVPWRVRVSLTTTLDFKTFTRLGILLPDLDTKDGCLFPEKINGKFLLIHRIYPNMYLTTSPDLKNWTNHQVLAITRKGMWDSERIGADPPPIKTAKGWLLIYHGVDNQKIYRLGLMILDLNNPNKVLHRSSKPIFEPEERYEKEGYVKNVVFSCGAVQKNSELFIYYGGADKVIGLATVSIREVLNTIKLG